MRNSECKHCLWKLVEACGSRRIFSKSSLKDEKDINFALVSDIVATKYQSEKTHINCIEAYRQFFCSLGQV